MIEITNTGGKIIISGLQSFQKQLIKNSLQLSNPKYHQMMRMGNWRAAKWAGEFVEYWKEDKKTGNLIIGRGCEFGVQDFLKSQKIEFAYISKLCDLSHDKEIKVNLPPRSYQNPVIEEFKLKDRGFGVIELSTGWGKTFFALKIAEIKKQKTLIIVHRGHLLSQFVEDVKNFCGIDAGIIQGKTFNIQDITIATIQTAKKMVDEIKDKFGLVIIDEAHLAITEDIIDFIWQITPKYLYAMTGSPLRSDAQHGALKWIFGKPIVSDILPHDTPKIHVFYTNVEIPMRTYPEIIEAQVESEERNEILGNIIKDYTKQGRCTLTLTKRVVHTQSLEELSKEYSIIPIYASTPQKIKAELLDKIRKGKLEYNGLLGTAPLLGTGTDIAKIDTVILASDIKSKALLIQCIGRSLRLLQGKPNPIIIDICDNNNPILFRQHKERMKYYKEKGWEVIYK